MSYRCCKGLFLKYFRLPVITVISDGALAEDGQIEITGNKKPRYSGGASGFQRSGVSGGEGLTGALDHRLQRLGAGILIGVQAFAVTSDTVFVDQGEAEAAFASSHDQAVHWSKSIGEGANGILSLDLSRHSYWVFLQMTRLRTVQR